MADFLNILTWSHQELIYIITYQKFQGERVVSYAWRIWWRHSFSGFCCNRLKIKYFKKCLKFFMQILLFQTSWIECSLLNLWGQKSGLLIPGTQNVPRTKPSWKMAYFKPDYLASTLPGCLLWYISDNLPKNEEEWWVQLNSVNLKVLRKQPPGTVLKK